jgi:hypothetical protein
MTLWSRTLERLGENKKSTVEDDGPGPNVFTTE